MLIMNIDDLMTNINNKELFDYVLNNKDALRIIFNSQCHDKETVSTHSSMLHCLFYKKILKNNNQKNIDFYNFFYENNCDLLNKLIENGLNLSLSGTYVYQKKNKEINVSIAKIILTTSKIPVNMVNDVYKTFLTYILSKYKDSQENKNHKEYYYYLLLNNMHYSFQDKLDLINNDKFRNHLYTYENLLAILNGLELNELNENHINKLIELGKNICDTNVNYKEILFNAINGFIKMKFEDCSEIDNSQNSLFLDFIKKTFMEKFQKQFKVNYEFYIFLMKSKFDDKAISLDDYHQYNNSGLNIYSEISEIEADKTLILTFMFSNNKLDIELIKYLISDEDSFLLKKNIYSSKLDIIKSAFHNYILKNIINKRKIDDYVEIISEIFDLKVFEKEFDDKVNNQYSNKVKIYSLLNNLLMDCSILTLNEKTNLYKKIIQILIDKDVQLINEMIVDEKGTVIREKLGVLSHLFYDKSNTRSLNLSQLEFNEINVLFFSNFKNDIFKYIVTLIKDGKLILSNDNLDIMDFFIDIANDCKVNKNTMEFENFMDLMPNPYKEGLNRQTFYHGLFMRNKLNKETINKIFEKNKANKNLFFIPNSKGITAVEYLLHNELKYNNKNNIEYKNSNYPDYLLLKDCILPEEQIKSEKVNKVKKEYKLKNVFDLILYTRDDSYDKKRMPFEYIFNLIKQTDIKNISNNSKKILNNYLIANIDKNFNDKSINIDDVNNLYDFLIQSNYDFFDIDNKDLFLKLVNDNHNNGVYNNIAKRVFDNEIKKLGGLDNFLINHGSLIYNDILFNHKFIKFNFFENTVLKNIFETQHIKNISYNKKIKIFKFKDNKLFNLENLNGFDDFEHEIIKDFIDYFNESEKKNINDFKLICDYVLNKIQVGNNVNINDGDKKRNLVLILNFIIKNSNNEHTSILLDKIATMKEEYNNKALKNYDAEKLSNHLYKLNFVSSFLVNKAEVNKNKKLKI